MTLLTRLVRQLPAGIENCRQPRQAGFDRRFDSDTTSRLVEALRDRFVLFDLVTIRVNDECDDTGAVFDRAGRCADRHVLGLKIFARGIDIGHLNANVTPRVA